MKCRIVADASLLFIV